MDKPKSLQDMSPAARLILTTTLEDPKRWDLADALQASEGELAILAHATDQDIEDALAFIRAKFSKGVQEAREMQDEG